MSTLQFPASPNDGDSFTASNGVTYTFDATGGTGWTANNPVGIDDEYVNIDGDTMTGDLVLPNLEASGNISADGDIQSTSQNGGQLAGFRNQIINGTFSAWQRGDSVTVASNNNTYTADRFVAFTNGSSAETVSRSNDAPLGAAYSFEMTANVSAIGQAIEVENGSEGPFTVGSTWTLSLWTKTNLTATNSPWRWRNSFTGSSVSVEAIAGNVTWTATGETDGAWSRWSTTQTITAGNVSGGLCLFVYLPYAGQYSATMNLALIQLEPGPVATPFEHRHIVTEIALCQRYYQQISANGLPWLNAGATVGEPTYVNVKLSTPMRTAAITADFTHVSYQGVGAGTSIQVPITSVQNYAHRGTVLLYVPTTGTTPNEIRILNGVGDGTDRKGIGSFDAEL